MTDAPPILAGVPGTFPHGVFHERHPKLIEQVIRARPYGPAERTALRELLAESTAGVIEPLHTEATDGPHWARWGAEMWGRPWDDASFLWAESYFYRRLLEATGYFGPGVWRGVDPFGPTKDAELAGPAVGDALSALADLADAPEREVRDAALVSALWGNQADLGFRLTAGAAHRDDRLLVDDSDVLWSVLAAATEPAVGVFADNAGLELLSDLILIDHLLTTGAAATVTLYLKPRPYYVSDATMSDLLAVLHMLCAGAGRAAAAVGQRLWQALVDGRLLARTHEFFCAPLSFHDMPADLAAEVAASAITIVKGDLNYRRLLGDREWPPTTPFAALTGYFPTRVIALRTLKSDVVAGLSADRVAALDVTGRPWRTSGERALIQAR